MKKLKKGFLFSTILAKKPKYGRYDLSFRNTMSMQYGKLTPTLFKKVTSGDRFKITTHALVKSMPMVAPTMTEIDLYVDTFYIPTRLVLGDQNFDKYINGEINLPSFNFSQTTAQTLRSLGSISRYAHYIGFNAYFEGVNPDSNTVNTYKLLPPMEKVRFGAIAKIWNDYYRDQWIEDELDVEAIINSNTSNVFNFELFSVKYPKDYFTSGLPFAQAGEPVTLPILSNAPIKFKVNTADPNAGTTLRTPAGELSTQSGQMIADGDNVTVGGNTQTIVDNSANLEVDMTRATAASIQQLRYAYRLQEFFERRARGGGRAIEIFLNVFGVVVPDYRLQRAEYIGGSRTPISINSVIQVSSTSDTSPQGNQAANAIGVSRTHTRRGFYEFKEPGYLIQFAYVLARQSYFQGLNRDLFVTNYLDEYWPQFQYIGEQEIKNYELFMPSGIASNNGATYNPTGTFAYTPRFAEYKFYSDEIHGELCNSLDFWQSSRKFENAPVLNSDFLSSAPSDIDKNFAVESTDTISSNKWVIAFHHEIDAVRPLDPNGTPRL